MYTSSMTIKIKVPNVIVKIACTGCGGDLIRHGESDTIGKKLECIPCGTTSFHAYHCENEKIDNVRNKIKEIKKVYKKAGYVVEPETVDEIINNLGRDFEAIFQ